MATLETGLYTLHAATATTVAETWSLSRLVREVWVGNRDTDPIFVTVAKGRTAARAEAAIVTAVAEADETFCIPPNSRVCVFRSKRPLYVAGSVVGNVSTYDIEGRRDRSPFPST